MILTKQAARKYEKIVVHPKSGPYTCRVLGIRFPNIRFTLPDSEDNIIYAEAKKGKLNRSTMMDIHDAIAVLTIVYQLTNGRIQEMLHG